ncbi:type IV secretory pathway TraG/TraD family ATPase VirD4 [Paenarthrobacter histidinolovorans]|uniref:Type IV secretory pathway TraG/TraD family ATPase VirD4 n=2 Tax=Paenarthrobacter histidinolovorans TaxID=43664 RepID=A0ABW8MZE5_9MICC
MQQRKTSTMTPGTMAGFLLLGTAATGILVVDAGIYGGSWISHDGQALPVNPMAAPFGLITGQVYWSQASTLCLAVALVVLLGVAAGVVKGRLKAAKDRSRVDYKAAVMGRGKDISMLTERGAKRAARRFKLKWPGIFLGTAVAGGARLYADVESVCLSIFGPRQGKSSTQVIPAVLDAPGAVVTTSNKPDVIDATRLPRSMKGTVWAFNPQKISPDRATWWWNPLSYVTDDDQAQKLSDIFKAAKSGPNSKGDDPYFDPEGIDLMAALFLAAAMGKKPVSIVYDWISGGRVAMEEPKRILREAKNGIYARHADGLEAQLQLDDGQRDGIVGTAKSSLKVLKSVGIQDWVNPKGPNDPRPQFSPETFVREAKDTLYLLSKEGGGSAAALTTALTVAVADAGENYAMTQRFRRLPVPMVFALDEIANVCPWKELPDKYSHYGSKGLLPMAWLQSYSQGEELWGEKGMRKIYSATTVKIIGSGLDEERYLREVSTIIGEYRYNTVNTSTSDRGQSVSVSPEGGKEPIFTASELSEMPIGRAVVKRAGAPTCLIKTVRWIEGPHADAVWLSLNIHDPSDDSEENAAKIIERRTRPGKREKRQGLDQKQDELVTAYLAAQAEAGGATPARVPAAAAPASRWLEALND